VSLAAAGKRGRRYQEDKKNQDFVDTPHWMTSTISCHFLIPSNSFFWF
jgi:hypothetical protein